METQHQLRWNWKNRNETLEEMEGWVLEDTHGDMGDVLLALVSGHVDGGGGGGGRSVRVLFVEETS